MFALGLIVNSGDLLDLKYVITTSENVTLSAKCVAKHLDLAGRSDIPVGIGTPFPAYADRGSVCGIPGLVGFALESECADVTLPFDYDGLSSMAQMIMDSGRDDWWYIVVGGQSTVRSLIEMYPEAAAKIDTLIVMAGNFCADFEPYPFVLAPTDETNIGCDPAAANFVLDGNVSPFNTVYYTPVVVADEIGGPDYIKIVEAAESGADPGAAATLEFYRAWSAAGRANPDLLIHAEANTYDPETESTPQFDPCAIMLALDVLADCDGPSRLATYDIGAVHFLEAGETLMQGNGTAIAAFSLLPDMFEIDVLPSQCPSLTPFTFDPASTPEEELPVTVALGYTSPEAKASFYADMAARMAGETPGCPDFYSY